ncbi:MAG: NAD(P)H-binding protein [Steroidobacteraceae bacterium]
MRNRIDRSGRRACVLGLAALGSAAALPAAAAPRGRAAQAGRIIISGAAGHLGELTVRALLARGIPASRLILVSRIPDGLKAFASQGASVRFGDFTKPESLPAAFAGGRQMLLISIGFGPMPRPQAHKNAIDAAKGAGVEHIAYTSWIGLARGDRSGLGADHYQTEETLKRSGIAWTMLRNSIYMEQTLPRAKRMISTGRAEVPGADTRIAYVARADCAAAAAAVLATGGHDDRAYDITGPQLIDTRTLAETASAVTGRPIRTEPAPPAPPGRPRPYAGSSVAVVSDAVARLKGGPAISLKAFFTEHRAELLAARSTRPS